MKKRFTYFKNILLICLLGLFIIGCGGKNEESEIELTDGEYKVNIIMEGGTGKASIISPSFLLVEKGQLMVTLVWTSKNYDYMIVNDVTYYNENVGGEATFTIPVASINEPLTIIADTTAMSVPHEIEYTLYFSLDESLGDKTGSVDLKYATRFSIDEYGEYKMITIADGGRFLLIPQNLCTPKGLEEDIVILKQPLDKTYLASSSVMDFICKLDALDNVRFCGTKKKDWYIDEAVLAMQNGELLYSGKYSSPDYELLTSNGCSFAIENTMLLHKPETKEKLEELGIPVLIEYSSYEEHPLGRLEWIKLYGALFGKSELAEEYFNEQEKCIGEVIKKEKTNKSVAFFYITSNGIVNVRKPKDYISKIIEMAGGEYALNNYIVEEENALSTMNIQMEDFYVAAKDADVIIYNSTIEGELDSIAELIEKSSLFKDFKAVKENKVYCTSKNFFQQISGMGEFIIDLNAILNETPKDLTYIKELK